MAKTGYPLDLVTPVRHVATELDRVAPAALSLGDLAGSYRHPIAADLTRVREREGCETDHDAIIFILDRAIDELGTQIASNGGGITLAKPFDELRYRRSKLVRLVATDNNDEKRALKAVYNDLREDRTFWVIVAGGRGSKKEHRFKLHPLARAIPQITEKEFYEMAADVKTHGVKLPIVVYAGQVLDGRHRVAIASALKVPLRVSEFIGTDPEARDHVLSLNVHRRHLTVAQRGLIVRELFLPEAKEKAEERHREGSARGGKATAEMQQPSRGPSAAQMAADASSGLANVRTVETMAPVDDAPETQERIRRGEIATAAEARREAIKETGQNEPESVPVQRPQTAWRDLGTALRNVTSAAKAIEEGRKGDITDDQIWGRIGEIRMELDRLEGLIGSD